MTSPGWIGTASQPSDLSRALIVGLCPIYPENLAEWGDCVAVRRATPFLNDAFVALHEGLWSGLPGLQTDGTLARSGRLSL